jgi:hypothetical protein
LSKTLILHNQGIEMEYDFKILPNSELESVVPFVFNLNQVKISKSVLLSRFNEMKNQSYECAIILSEGEIVYGMDSPIL